MNFIFKIISGETPLHIAIVYNDINSVKLLIKHGVDVNKCVVGDFTTPEPIRSNGETRKGKQTSTRSLFSRSSTRQKQFNPQTSSPESK